MKEMYVKPQLHVEHFTLSQSIAQSCGWNDDGFYGRPTHEDIHRCGWEEFDDDDKSDIFWTSSSSHCKMQVGDDYVVSEGCYNAPNGNGQIFAS